MSAEAFLSSAGVFIYLFIGMILFVLQTAQSGVWIARDLDGSEMFQFNRDAGFLAVSSVR